MKWFAPIIALLAALPVQAQHLITKGAVDQGVIIRIVDSADGTPETGVVFNTSGLDLEYRRDGAVSVDITEVTLAALTTAHTDGGFLHIGNGYYRLDLPDVAVATGANKVLVHGTCTGMVVIGCVVQLTAVDFQDGVRFGMTALPNAVPGASGGVTIAGSNAATTFATLTSTGAFTINGVSNVAQTGDSFARIGVAGAGLTNIDLPNQTMDVTGNLSGSVGSVTGATFPVGTIAAASDVPTAANNADAVWDELLADHVTADTFGQAMNWLKAAFESSGVYSEAALANAPEGGGTILTDVDQEPVPTSRVFDLIPTEDQGLISENPKSIVIGADPNTYAVDFKVDMPTNGRIATVSAPTIASGTSGGITFANLGRDKSQAKFRPTAVTAGEYEVEVEVTYTTGGGAIGKVLYTVPE